MKMEVEKGEVIVPEKKQITAQEAIFMMEKLANHLKMARTLFDARPKTPVETLVCRWIDRGLEGHERLEKKLKALGV